MKRLQHIPALFIALMFFLAACKKDSYNSPVIVEHPEFSFTYNGQTYSGMNYCALMLNQASRLEGIIINKEDVFGGKIYCYFQPSLCVYLQPTGTLIAPNRPDCLLRNANGGPIDSSQVFIYRSGSINTAYSNCQHKTDIFTNIEYDECTATGSFSLVIGNNSGQTKNITGTFKFLGMRR